MDTSIYPLPSGMGIRQKLNTRFGMAMRINYFFGDEYGIAKSMPVPPRRHL